MKYVNSACIGLGIGGLLFGSEELWWLWLIVIGVNLLAVATAD